MSEKITPTAYIKKSKKIFFLQKLGSIGDRIVVGNF